MSVLRAVKGMNDILPGEIGRWHRLETTFRETARLYGYGEARTPILESTALFKRSIGEATDIVSKEMFSFEDQGNESLTVRPEGTAPAVRAYIEHNIQALEPITKWFYLGPMFRRERPARGRFRQFYQAGLECFGDPGPYVDAEMIDMVVRVLRELGVNDLEVLVNSLGDAAARARYRDALLAFLTPHTEALSAESQKRLVLNPLRILDSKSPTDQEIVKGAPNIFDFLSAEDRAHFETLTSLLDRFGVRYRVEPQLVRGLDYYSRTLFEIQGRGGELGAQNALCGGGRYDGLVKSLGGPDVPSIGFAMGIERILLAIPESTSSDAFDVVIVCPDASLRAEAAMLLRDLRASGVRAEADLRGQSMKSQLRRADKLGAKVVIIVGGDEFARGVVQLKDMQAGEGAPRVEVPRDSAVDEVRRALSTGARGAGA